MNPYYRFWNEKGKSYAEVGDRMRAWNCGKGGKLDWTIGFVVPPSIHETILVPRDDEIAAQVGIAVVSQERCYSTEEIRVLGIRGHIDEVMQSYTAEGVLRWCEIINKTWERHKVSLV